MSETKANGARWNFRFWRGDFYDSRNHVYTLLSASAIGGIAGWMTRSIGLKHYSHKVLKEAIANKNISIDPDLMRDPHNRMQARLDAHNIRQEANTPAWKEVLLKLAYLLDDCELNYPSSLIDRKGLLKALHPQGLRKANGFAAVAAVAIGAVALIGAEKRVAAMDKKHPGYADAYNNPERHKNWVQEHAENMPREDRVRLGLEKR